MTGSRRPRVVTRDTRLAQMERDALQAAVEADFRQHGGATIERLRVEMPGEYLRLVAAIHPADIKPMVRRQAPHDFSDDELRALLWQGLAEDGIGPERLREIEDNWAAFFERFTSTPVWKDALNCLGIPSPPHARRAGT